jgi:NTE family protein
MENHKRIGLALGGGVVRGMAHIGVLSVLEQAGIPIDCVAGSSVGSVIGAAYCAGLSPEQLYQFASMVSWWRIARPVWPVRGLVSFQRLERLLMRELGDISFADLRIPFAVVATDLIQAEIVVLHRGKVAPAVRASCSVPGVVVPAELDGRLLCDGNFSDSVPVSVVRQMGASYVIGVDIFTPKIRPNLGPLGYGVAGIEILIQAAGGGIRSADCLISPNLAGKTYLLFSKRDELFELGAQAARSSLAEIRNALAV